MKLSKCLTILILLLCEILCAGTGRVRADDDRSADNDPTQFYGFGPLEVFNLEQRSSGMQRADLNHDGLLDIALIDNSHSRIDVLQQRSEPPANDDDSARDVNAIAGGWRFEHIKIPVDKQIAAMSNGDFDGDGRTDLVYFGVPDRLVIRYQPESGDWTRRETIRLPGVDASAWTISGGDLNGDERDDLVVLGKSITYLLLQTADGRMAAPERLMNTSSEIGLIQIADLDGDGKNDLCYLSNEDAERGLCARLQDADGHIGPELRFDLNRPRAIALFDLDQQPGCEILTIDSQTGRVNVSQVRRPEPKPGELAGRLVQYGFGEQGSGKDRDLAIGDLDGDGLLDVVVTDPEQAQMIVFRQHAGRGLDLGSSYPGLLGAGQVRVADFDGDHRAEVVVLSAKEKTLAISRFDADSHRLTFPQTLPIESGAEPLVVDVVRQGADGPNRIVYIEHHGDSPRGAYTLRALTPKTDGTWEPAKFGMESGVELTLKKSPTELMHLDANRDGNMDFLVFVEFSPPVLLTGNVDGTLAVVEADGGIRIGEVSPGALFVGGPHDQTILAVQDAFARRLRLDNNLWQVDDQYNAVESAAKVAGAAAINLDGVAGDEIVLIDSGVKTLRILHNEEQAQVFRPWREVELGNFTYRKSMVADLNGDKKDDLLLLGGGRFAVLYADQTDPIIDEIASFETKLDKVFFQDLVAGDLNGDGMADIAAIDTRSHFIEVISYHPEHGLRHALHWKVFEEKSFSDERRTGSEPREAVVTDVTADGRSDLLLLTHDRVLLYPQD